MHEPYDLVEFVEVIESVGYQGTLAIDFRGEGDPERAVKHARDLLAYALGEQPELDADDDGLGPGVDGVRLAHAGGASVTDSPVSSAGVSQAPRRSKKRWA